MRAALFSLLLSASAGYAATLEGIEVPGSISLAGQNLVLNGAAVTRISIFKADVVSLYVPARKQSLEGVGDQPGPKRLQMVRLRDARGDDIARKLISDFEAASAPAERNNLINEMVQLGGMLSNRANKGDVLTLDWIPNQGLVISRNGVHLSEKPIASELLFRVLLRIFLGPKAPEDTREKLLGRRPWEE